MSANTDEEKESQKTFPLDLARNQISAVRTVESGKAPLVMTSQALRNVRVLTAQGVPSSSSVSVGQTIITNLVPGPVIRQDPPRITSIVGTTQTQPQVSGNVAIQRSAQITLSATPIVAAQNPTGTSYHVPRGPAVVANLAAPRSNVATVRTPLVITPQNSQTHAFVRPPRTISPAQGAAWINTNTTNVSQIKGTPNVLTAPIRAVAGKPQAIARPQLGQPMTTIRSSMLLSNAITVGQTVQPFKTAPGTVQIGSAVTLGQMLPPRTQTVVYGASSNTQFTPTARITLTTTAQNQVKPALPRTVGPIASGTRLTVPISQVQAAQSTRMVTAVQAPIQRIPVVSSSQPQPVLSATTRIVTAQSPANIVGRVAVNPSTASGNISNTSNILTTQARISTISTLNLQSIMAVANGGAARVQQTSQGPKVITQPAATIHLTQISPQHLKTNTPTVVTTAPRTINVPASAIVAQRPTSSVPPQAISIAAKVFTTTENQVNPGTTNVYIHTSVQAQAQRHPSPSPQNAPGPTLQQGVPSVPPSTGPPFSLAGQESGSFFYQNSAPAGSFQRAFVEQQANAFVAQSQPSQVVRPPISVGNQQFQGMRLGSVMVVDPSRSQPNPQFQSIVSAQVPSAQAAPDSQSLAEQSQLSQAQNKIISSPRPSILRKRDHEGSPLKAAKNLASALQGLSQQSPSQAPTSPASPPRPDSRGNGHSSGGSTTLSATSSPGLPEVNEDSNPVSMNLKDDDDEELKPPAEVSPRKKPRKQQLTGNDNDENHDDMQFISENKAAKKEAYDSDGPNSDSARKAIPDVSRIATLRKPATASLLNGYRQTWKATHNHYQRHSDVRPKDERRPTIIDLANQNRVLEKVNGWKIYHLSTQMEDLAEQEQCMYDQLTDLLKFTESEENSKQNDKEVNRVNELIKGNLQRIKIINDGMLDAKCQIMKVFDHQRHVNDILSRCASKRNFKKREKS